MGITGASLPCEGDSQGDGTALIQSLAAASRGTRRKPSHCFLEAAIRACVCPCMHAAFVSLRLTLSRSTGTFMSGARESPLQSSQCVYYHSRGNIMRGDLALLVPFTAIYDIYSPSERSADLYE